MGRECHKYHSRLAEPIAIKKGKTYAKTMSWIRSRISFALLRPVLVCLRGSRAKRRAMYHDIRDADMKIKKAPFRDREDMVYILLLFQHHNCRQCCFGPLGLISAVLLLILLLLLLLLLLYIIIVYFLYFFWTWSTKWVEITDVWDL